MWYLQNLRDASFRLPLPSGRDLVVGRKDCDLLISDDKSISRRHALIHVDSNQRTSSITLTDCKSKFGTMLGERRLSSGEKAQMGVGDVVRFGQGPTSSKFRIIFEPIVLCCSSMSATDKQRVKQLAKELGGRMVGNWSSECSHLIMSSLTVTIKVVCALACCKPIVTIKWLEEALPCFRDNRVLPSTAQHLPPIVDEDIGSNSEVSFAPSFIRSTLFQDRVFHFFNESQLASLRMCLTSAGARYALIDKPGSVAMEKLVAKESIVIDLKDDTDSVSGRDWAGQVKQFLSSHDLRAIPESEIGFALLHVSIEMYCNPRNKEGVQGANVSLVPPSLSQIPDIYTQSQAGPPPTPSPSPSLSDVTILAPNSQLSTQSSSTGGATQTNGGIVKMKGSLKLKKDKVPETPTNIKLTTSDEREGREEEAMVELRRRPPSTAAKKITDFVKPTQPVSLRSSGPVSPPPVAKRIKTESNSEDDLEGSDDIVEDSQPDSPESSKKLTGLSLKRKTPSGKKPSIVYQSQGDVPASQSLESDHSAPNVSLLAPNSLTPGSTQKRGSSKSSLPGASFMTGLFGSSQKKKRKAEETEDLPENGERKRIRKESQDQSDDVMECNREKDSLPKLELFEDSLERDDIERKSLKEESQSDSEVRSKMSHQTQLTPAGPLATSTQATGRKTPARQTKIGVSPIVSTTPFISTRKRKKKEAGLDTSKIPQMSFSEAADLNASMFSNTQATQNDLLTPFTRLTTRNSVAAPASIFTTTGRRSKVNQTEADILWIEEGEGGEGENPLGTQYEEPPTGKRYKPVLSEDGFIKARVKPKLETQRVGRFARMAKSEYLASDSPPSGDSVGEGVASQERGHAQVCYQVEVVSLVTVGSGRRRAIETEEENIENSGIKNFKKFQKVGNVGSGSVPRFLTLTRYIPPSTSGVANWSVTDDHQSNARQSSEREEESQDSQNIFSLSKVKRKRYGK